MTDPKPPNQDPEDPGPSTEILQLVNASLAAEPGRADLWMMRFEVQKSLGLRQAFAEALAQCWRDERVARRLDWAAVRALWDELAPGEPPPAGVPLPPARPMPGPFQPSPGAAARRRRFSDVAAAVAGRELAVFAKAYAALHARPGFLDECAQQLAPLLKRPTPLQFAERLSRVAGPHVRIFLKREDLRSVSPELENAAAQAFVASRLARGTLITGNDVDAHSLALAEVAPAFQLRCTVVVRPEDLEGKSGLVARLRGLGARVEAMPTAGMLSADPREGALRLWQKSLGQAHLALSPGAGPSPYPAMANNFQSLLGREVHQQLDAIAADGRPRTLVAAVQSEADSIGLVLPFLTHPELELVFAEPEPGGIESWRPSQRRRAYNGVVREHAWLKGTGRIEHVPIADAQAQAAQRQVMAAEKIGVSLEDGRALALTLLLAQRSGTPHDFVVLVA